MPTIIFDKKATEFRADHHPERPARLVKTEAYLRDNHPGWDWAEPRLASEQEILSVHHPKHLERLRRSLDFDADTPYYPGIEQHARRAAGAAIGSVDLALGGHHSSVSLLSWHRCCFAGERLQLADPTAERGVQTCLGGS